MSTNAPPSFSNATVGKKILMAITGFLIIGFVIVHLVGNLQIFIGQHQLNVYAETLQNMGALKWAFRIALLVFFLVHIWKGIVLWLENRSARPVSYTKETNQESTLASRTMIYTGALIVFFVAYHISHFTLLDCHPEYQSLPLVDGRFDVYSMIILGFSEPLIAALYIIFVGLVAFHISHAFSSLFQTLGLTKPELLKRLRLFGALLAWLIFLAYASIPVAVLAKIITLPGGGH
ncbi:MAG: succinate:quinone oxidoreductase [Calditrichaeota bacterium]|nr:MAG: succinate:quinone oxidoreductase [Calditrichota bacterium]